MDRIQTRFPSLAIEKELAQVVGRSDAAGMTDAEACHAMLSHRDHRYLARKPPLWASEISPGLGVLPPPISAAVEIVWCGARNGRVSIRPWARPIAE